MNTAAILTVALATGYLSVVQGQARCGDRCVPFDQCPHMNELLNLPDITPEQTDLLIKSFCGYQNSRMLTPKVCCTKAPTASVEHSTADEARKCYTPDGLPGKWMSLSSCPRIKVMLSKKPRPTKTTECESLLYYSVCCQSEELTNDLSPMTSRPSPKVPSRVPSSTNAPPRTPPSVVEKPTANEGRKCYTPDGLPGICVQLNSCPRLMAMLSKKPLPRVTKEFVQNSKCPEYQTVCCQSEDPLNDSCMTPSPLLRSRDFGCCGRITSTSNRIAGGSTTSIDQYPWLTLIEYTDKQKTISLNCGGSLISGRYVLTAAHCVSGSKMKNYWTPVNIRLGEYDTSNEGRDCIEGDGGGEECTDGTTTIPIETIVVHPGFNPTKTEQGHDIAIIRMKWLAPYTDFIQPICLPSVDVASLSGGNISFWAAGWGRVSPKQASSDVKRHVQLPYVPIEQCQLSYYVPPKLRVPLIKGQLCAGGETGKDTSSGDSGGSLVYRHNKVFELVGVVSFGLKTYETKPAVYTSVYQYNNWIVSNMKP